MTALKRACKIVRRRVLLSALEEAYQYVIDHPPELTSINRQLLLSKLEQEIAWVKSRIERLEPLEENPKRFVRSRLVWTKPDGSDLMSFLEFSAKRGGPWKREEELK